MVARYCVVVFTITVLLVLTVLLRSSDNRFFYRLHSITLKQDQLRREIANKQLQLEWYMNSETIGAYRNEQDNEQ